MSGLRDSGSIRISGSIDTQQLWQLEGHQGRSRSCREQHLIAHLRDGGAVWSRQSVDMESIISNDQISLGYSQFSVNLLLDPRQDTGYVSDGAMRDREKRHRDSGSSGWLA